MVMRLFGEVFAGKKILLTGHTGFKGSWLSLWLKQLGATVYGISLPANTHPSHFQLSSIDCESSMLDISNKDLLQQKVADFSPELVFHLAAQPLVRLSYQQPVDTWQTNVMGTVNLLEACRHSSSVRAVVVITTDKVYENVGQSVGYVETDPLGGHDPYSASKAACELVVQSYQRSFLQQQGILLASARAGNVVGGGDWAQDRLIPDVIRACQQGSPLIVRYPLAVRPWQHVLDSLSGYLCIAAELLQGKESFATNWNFGPSPEATQNVATVLSEMKKFWPELTWQQDVSTLVQEAQLLTLDSRKANERLGWKSVWDFQKTAEQTALWYQKYYQQKQVISLQQLASYSQDAKQQGLAWALNYN
jgi:CDP-glucose 4,6-dehydratase